MTDPYARNSLPFFGTFTPKDFAACVTPTNPYEVTGTTESQVSVLVPLGILASSGF